MNRRVMVLLAGILLPSLLRAYPIDGYPETGIRRVEGVRLVEEGVIPGRRQPPGALLPTARVDLRLLDYPDLELPTPDPVFTRQIRELLGADADRYGLAVLDLSDPAHPRYAEHRADHRQNVGSVGKLLVALGVFQGLADAWPEDLEKRRQVLRDTMITADAFSHWDHHKIKIFDVTAKTLTRHTMRDGDRGNLWEYLDWTLSVSSNAAAAMTMREAMLIRRYGKDYPPPEAEIRRFFAETPKSELKDLFITTFFEPVTRNGLDLEQLRQGSFFTRTGKQLVPGGGSSYGTARELMKFTLRMEQGRLVDEFSSRAIKRLLYMTERRIRYAASPALRDSAVYFKSGSLYSCREEEGFACGQYMGNVKNYMNSVAIVETLAPEHRLDYIVTLLSNVLRTNSAVAHQTLATRIHRLIEKAHSGSGSAGKSQQSPESAEAGAP
ncbi:MAG: hypothetical protein PVJ15_04270 [Gammaproteobacteria bacterium]|jgi:hypothetical protein